MTCTNRNKKSKKIDKVKKNSAAPAPPVDQNQTPHSPVASGANQAPPPSDSVHLQAEVDRLRAELAQYQAELVAEQDANDKLLEYALKMEKKSKELEDACNDYVQTITELVDARAANA